MTEQTERRFQDALHLVALWSFAVAQPVFDRLASNPTFLTDLRISRTSVVIVVVLFCMAGPTIMICAELLVSMLHRGVRRRLHDTFIALSIAVIILPLLCRIRFLPGMMHIGMALASGLLGAFLNRRFDWMRMLLTGAAPAIIAFPCWLLFFSSVAQMLFPKTRPMEVSVGNPVPVVLVVLDEFCAAWLWNERAEIDATRFPNFAALAQHATWFRNATSVNPTTAYAVPAILTGQYQRGERRPDVVDHPVNLFTLLLAAKSHEMTVFESGSRLYPDQAEPENVYPPSTIEQVENLLWDLSIVYLHHVVPVDYRAALPPLPRHWFGLLPNEQVQPEKQTGVIRYAWDRDRDRQFEHFVSCIGPSDRPRFYYLHLVIPHHPWSFLPSGRKYRLDSGLGVEPVGTTTSHHLAWGSDELAIAHGVQQYLLQIGYADQLLGRLIDRLKAAGYYDDCLFILVADHGVSFRPNASRRMPTRNNLPDLMPVPLFVKLPHQTSGTTEDRNVENIDVFPTIADFLAMTPRVECDGYSMLGTAHADRPLKRFFNGTELEAVAADFQSRFQALQPVLRRFGFGAGWDGVFQLGPHKDLIGSSSADIQIAGRSTVQITLTPWQHSYSEDPGDLVPCFINGRVRPAPPADQPINLAIAINDTVRAVTRTYQMAGIEDTWSAIVPEHSFRIGDNSLRVFEVRTRDGTRTLWECELAVDSQ